MQSRFLRQKIREVVSREEKRKKVSEINAETLQRQRLLQLMEAEESSLL